MISVQNGDFDEKSADRASSADSVATVSTADEAADSGRPGSCALAEELCGERGDAAPLKEAEWDLISEHHQFYMGCLLLTECRLKQTVARYIGKLLDDGYSDIGSLQKEGLYPVPDLQLDSKMYSHLVFPIVFVPGTFRNHFFLRK